ncbi:MAG: cation diffusion facilitator family transporter [Acidimicrobiia bacterium]|nr:cation diffusion facilitator family transporter [Acidimicrobiia bacterium]
MTPDPSDHAEQAHGLGSSHGHGHTVDGNRRLLLLVLALNGGFMVVEIVGGILFGSLALLADAAHMASDVAGIVIALIAQSLIGRAPSQRLTFGLIRSEVLAAQANGILLVATGGWILYEALRRIGDAPEIAGGGVTVVASIGLLINVGSAWLLFGARHDNLNMRGAFLHMSADAAGSVAAVVAGLAALLGRLYWVDPAVSVLIAGLVLWAAWGLLRDATHVLLEGAPPHVTANDIVDAVADLPEVDGIHHLHLWYLASDSVALSGHVVLDGEPSLHEAQEVGDQVRQLLRERFGIVHATLELECHHCETATAAHR